MDPISFIIISSEGKIPASNLKSALGFGKVYFLHPPHTPDIDSPEVENFPLNVPVPNLLNTILHDCQTQYLAVTGAGVKISQTLPQKLMDVPTSAGLIYGNYVEDIQGNIIPKFAYSGPEDITERAELGPLMIYNTGWLKNISGWDQSLRFACDYDLRLRLGELKSIYYINDVLCELTDFQADEDHSSKLFFPGKGRFGGFSYLFMDPEAEKETEAVFLKSLKRRGAFLEGDAPPMKPEPLTSPAISIITPVYNREKFIGQTIESVINSTFRDFEHIIIDNGSTDNTVKVVEKFLSDTRIRLIRNPVNRIALSLNLGVAQARGKYIAQLDSDDLYLPRTLELMLTFMQDTNCALGISYYSLIDAEGLDLPEYGVIRHLEYSRNNILRVDGAGAVRMWRRSAIKKFGGFDQGELCDYGEDYDLILKVGEWYQVGRVGEVLYKYRRHPDNSDIRRDPLFKLRNKNLARQRALKRRAIMNNYPYPEVL